MWYNVRVDVQRPDRVTISMPKELVQEARAKAIKQGTTLSALVRRFVELWLAGEIELPPEKPERGKRKK